MNRKPELACVIGLLIVGAYIGSSLNQILDFGNVSEFIQAISSIITVCIAWVAYRNWKRPEVYVRYVELLDQQHSLFIDWYHETYRIFFWAEAKIYNSYSPEEINEISTNKFVIKMIDYMNFSDKHIGFIEIHSTHSESKSLVEQLSYKVINAQLSKIRVKLLMLATNMSGQFENLNLSEDVKGELEIIRDELNDMLHNYNATYNKLLQ
ncbi:hypothetical protein [Aeromonas veronii]|uniref:hypothetical protein n=1 Tax=Aeromonas veronii TaxID=654 RepID=UPI001115B471|nr:hypothetical protein [Aeromonas veronii]